MSNNNITAALLEAKASAVMIVEEIFGESGTEYVAAKVAIANAENRPSPLTALKAEEACLAYLESAPQLAMTEINARIAKRAAKAPLSDAAQRIINGQD